MKPWAMEGGPDEATLRRMIEVDGHNDSEVADLFGVARQTAAYWRTKIGIAVPGMGTGQRKRRRPRISHKDLIWWEVKAGHMNNPIRKRLVEISSQRQGVRLPADAEGRAADFLKFLTDEDVVVAYDPEHRDGDGEPAPFFFVPRDPKLDAAGDIVRRS